MRFALLLVIAACGSKSAPRVADQHVDARRVASNADRPDYIGSEACADCHHEIYEKWAASPMRNMTRDATTAQIRAPFDGASLAIGPDTATMTMEGATRFMSVSGPSHGGTEKFRITKVVGGHYREDFVGVEVRDSTQVERVLPATFVFSTASWRYKGYSVMVKERPAMSATGAWRQECIPCHNTLPLATLLYDDLGGKSVPAYQGKLQDRLLPERSKFTAVVRDEQLLAKSLADEIRFLGEPPPTSTSVAALLPEAAQATRDRLDGTKLVEIGVGCEACHNGSREHVTKPERLPTFEPRSAAFAVTPPPQHSGSRAQWINQTCAKCHTVLFSRYPWTWEGGERRKNPGGSTTNSGEGRDFKLGGCATELACTQCHDPHTVDAPAALAKQGTVAGNHLCEACHPQIAANPTAHSHHAASSAGNSCIGCHMPKKNMGLSYELVRYHRIGSPNAKERIGRDRPIECALCHADKSIESLASTVEQWWKRPVDRGALRALYGADLSQTAIIATLARGKPHEQAAAIATLGASKDRSAIPLLVPHLAHEYPLVRFYAKHALEQILGAPVPIDVNQSASAIQAAAAAWLPTVGR